MEEKKLVWENFMSSYQDARANRIERMFVLNETNLNQDREIVLDLAYSQLDLFSFIQSYEEVKKVSAVSHILEPLGKT